MANPEEIEESSDEIVKKMMFVMRKAPHGTINPYEGLEVMLIVAAYDQDLSAVFLDDGVYAIKKGQDPKEIGVKDFSTTFRVLPGYGIEKIYVEKESLENRGLTVEDLLLEVEVVDKSEVTKLMQEQDVLFPF
ncbi:MAG: sulfurtransferase complex subunit TusC [Nitrospirota bacterium]|nr:sulfurtransferase complex subunit TusC [Nitrospirota bacterium]